MEVTKVIAQGDKLADFITSVKNKLKREHTDCYFYQKDRITVIAIEQFFFRVSSNLLTFLVFNETEESQCDIVIISGGGSFGSFGITWGSENRANKNLIELLEETGVKDDIKLQFVFNANVKTNKPGR